MVTEDVGSHHSAIYMPASLHTAAKGDFAATASN